MTTTHVKRMRRALARGVTLIEILIVLAIVGLIAGGVAVVAVPKYEEAQKNQAKIDARTIHPVAEKYKVDHPGQCPTVEQLRAEKELSAASKITDPWDSPYRDPVWRRRGRGQLVGPGQEGGHAGRHPHPGERRHGGEAVGSP